jgi:uncharacterized protein (TIRG00374 family)
MSRLGGPPRAAHAADVDAGYVNTTRIPSLPAPTFRWGRRVAAVVVTVLAAWFVITNRAELADALSAVGQADGRWLAVGTMLAVAGMANKGMLQAAAQRAAGLDAPPLSLVPVTAAAGALNDVAKSSGVAGMAVFVADASRRERAAGPTVAAYVLARIAGDLAFCVTLLVSLQLLASSGHLSPTDIMAAIVFALMVVSKLMLVVAAVHSRRSVRRLFSLPARVAALLRRRTMSTAWESAADDLFDATKLIGRRPQGCLLVEAHALATELIGIAVLWASMAAVGIAVHPIVPVVGYGVAVLFANVSFVPGGVGFVELSLGAALVQFGTPGTDAAAAVLVFRLFDLWLPLAAGAWCARGMRRPDLVTRPSDVAPVVSPVCEGALP